MTLVTPYITDKFTSYLGDDRTTVLSIAVWLTDDYTKSVPIGSIKVKMKDMDIIALRNLSGYYCFTGLLPGSYKVIVESGLYFPPDASSVNIPVPDPKKSLGIILKPKPSYPFASGATLVRGVVSGPSVNASVKVTGKTIETITDENGEFVLYFKGIKEENITIEIKNTEGTGSVPVTVKEGETISVGKIILS